MLPVQRFSIVCKQCHVVGVLGKSCEMSQTKDEKGGLRDKFNAGIMIDLFEIWYIVLTVIGIAQTNVTPKNSIR
jgi:hypothetical protein